MCLKEKNANYLLRLKVRFEEINLIVWNPPFAVKFVLAKFSTLVFRTTVTAAVLQKTFYLFSTFSLAPLEIMPARRGLSNNDATLPRVLRENRTYGRQRKPAISCINIQMFVWMRWCFSKLDGKL